VIATAREVAVPQPPQASKAYVVATRHHYPQANHPNANLEEPRDPRLFSVTRGCGIPGRGRAGDTWAARGGHAPAGARNRKAAAACLLRAVATASIQQQQQLAMSGQASFSIG